MVIYYYSTVEVKARFFFEIEYSFDSSTIISVDRKYT